MALLEAMFAWDGTTTQGLVCCSCNDIYCFANVLFKWMLRKNHREKYKGKIPTCFLDMSLLTLVNLGFTFVSPVCPSLTQKLTSLFKRLYKKGLSHPPHIDIWDIQCFLIVWMINVPRLQPSGGFSDSSQEGKLHTNSFLFAVFIYLIVYLAGTMHSNEHLQH